jgi:hypothetical protein
VVYPTTAPLYPLFAGGLEVGAHIGGSEKFPSSAQLGAKCVTAVAALYEWSFHARALTPTLRFGYVSWLALLVAVMLVMRALGKGRTRLEVVTLAIVGCLPSVYMPLLQFFHPEDLLATALSLAGVAFALRGRWFAAGFILGLALLSQQFALLMLIPLVVLAPRAKLPRMLTGVASSFVGVAVPLLLASSGRALTSIIIGTGNVGAPNITFYGIPLHTSTEVVSLRLTAVVVSALVALWVRSRSRTIDLEPVALLALLALCLALRLFFEVSLFGYYVMPVSLLLLLVEIASGRIRLTYVVWTGIVTWTTVGGGLVDRGTFAGVAVGVWQFVIVATAGYLAAKPLLASMRVLSTTSTTPSY